jgi:hypothetical protein
MGDDSVLGGGRLSYWLDVADRATRTAAQTAAGMLGAQALGVLEVDWQGIASVSAVAALASVLSSIGARGFGADTTTASIVPNISARPIAEDSEPRGRHALGEE